MPNQIENQDQLHIIVQAGGRGSRLRHHTWNKPKCLVSIQGKPILYHLFDYFPNAKFIIIGDYLFEQLEKYLQVNPPGVEYELIHTDQAGTSAGIADAQQKVPPECPLLLTWSDLLINNLPPLPRGDQPTICTTSAFTCRWSVAPQGGLHEKPSPTNGIPGIFYFAKASIFPTPPIKGEFVKWFAANIQQYELLDCPDLEELGDFATIEENNERIGFSRFFNKVEVGEARVTKTVIDSNYSQIHEREVAWYHDAKKLGFRRIPQIYSENPLIMERIRGEHAYQMKDLSERERRAVMADYLDSLIALHDLAKAPANFDDIREVYISKTISRVNSVAKIIPGFDRNEITVNGKKCRNIFSEKHRGNLEKFLPILEPTEFAAIHGDPTFSNSLIDDKLRVCFIDPRGYFAKPGIMGDSWYDFAKVYYSAVGGYDAFNRRQFKLHVDEETVEILMEEPLFAQTAKPIFSDYFGKDVARIEILHGLIWLALSGYAKDDIDSIIGSFYLGLYWLETGSSKL